MLRIITNCIIVYIFVVCIKAQMNYKTQVPNFCAIAHSIQFTYFFFSCFLYAHIIAFTCHRLTLSFSKVWCCRFGRYVMIIARWWKQQRYIVGSLYAYQTLYCVRNVSIYLYILYTTAKFPHPSILFNAYTHKYTTQHKHNTYTVREKESETLTHIHIY